MPRSSDKRGSGKGGRYKKVEPLWLHCDNRKSSKSNDLAAWASVDQCETRRLHLPTIESELSKFNKPCQALNMQSATVAEKQTGLLFPPIHQFDNRSPSLPKIALENSEPAHNIIIGSPRASAGVYTRTFEHSLLKKSGKRDRIKLPKLQIRINKSLTVDQASLNPRALTPPLPSPAKLPPIDVGQMPYIPVNIMDSRSKSSPARRHILSANRFPELVIHGNNAPRCKIDIENKMSKADKSSQRRKMVHVEMHLLR
ncbi:uncharacterized protein LOC102803411 [Saccoglossus kowalevskii]|uniref:Uncharacterized protein LOC102803411 n=1 Tax=Saccoglossus kowalevskii TaxID=10224 RepID=A0ABM0MAL1_SACKO|nr:PREDICTED: uncharacterized protein LOC102803411 [Saccoglossus kowalevskii]